MRPSPTLPLFLAFACCCAGFSARGQVVYSNEFLSVGAGARAQALGNSVIASSTDIYATYWNPAGLAGVDASTGLLAGAMHAEQFAGVAKYDYLAVSLPLNGAGRRLGVSFYRQGVDDIPNTLGLIAPDGSLNYDNITSFSTADYAVLVSYAQPTRFMGGNLAVGGNLKVIRRVIGSFASSWGVGLDLGARYAKGPLNVGVTLRDATTTFNAWNTTLTEEEKAVLVRTDNSLPATSSVEQTRPSILPAVRYRFAYRQLGFAPEVAAWITTDGNRNALVVGDPVSVDLNAGLEVDYQQKVFLRFGLDRWQRYAPLGKDDAKLDPRPAVGVGVKLNRVALDYALSNPGDDQDLYAHVFSLQVGLRRPDASGGE